MKTVMRAPTLNLLRAKDPSINKLIERTAPLRKRGVPRKKVRAPRSYSSGEKHREAWAKWVGLPSGLLPELASKFMLELHGGRTIRDMTGYGEHHLCSAERFRKHCELNPDWGKEAHRLSTSNSNRKKSVNNWKVGKAFEFCMSGRHRMEGDNGKANKRSNRFCRACRDEKATRPMTAEEILTVKHAVSVEKRTIRNITTGVPVGGGSPNYSRVIVYAGRLAAQFQRDPEFASFVKLHTTQNAGRSRLIRYSRVRVAVVRQQNNDYHAIRSMIPESNPHRDDIVARIFEDLLGGSLKRHEVPARVKVYISELNKMYPTKYAKFGDSPLLSLDDVLFEDGTATRGDTVSRGLWD
jgi:hypothetical protein